MSRAGLNMMKRRVKHCHPMVANTALDLILAAYEDLMGNNVLYAEWKASYPGASDKLLQTKWIERNWGRGVEAARATLAKMLNPQMCPALDEDARERIHEALVLDNSLKMGRKGIESLTH